MVGDGGLNTKVRTSCPFHLDFLKSLGFLEANTATSRNVLEADGDTARIHHCMDQSSKSIDTMIVRKTSRIVVRIAPSAAQGPIQGNRAAHKGNSLEPNRVIVRPRCFVDQGSDDVRAMMHRSR